jgi:hypothetical protein
MKARWQNWAGCDTQRDGASVDARTKRQHCSRGPRSGGADDDDWDYENESAPEPDFNGGGGAPLGAEAQVPNLTEAASQNQRPRCPNLTEAAAPHQSPGARNLRRRRVRTEAEAAGGAEDDFDADSEPEDAATDGTMWGRLGAPG